MNRYIHATQYIWAKYLFFLSYPSLKSDFF